jgi:hypothetical protein
MRMMPYRVAAKKAAYLSVYPTVSKFRNLLLLLILLMNSGVFLLAQQSSDGSDDSDGSSAGAGSGSTGSASSSGGRRASSGASQNSAAQGSEGSGSQGEFSGHLPLPPDSSTTVPANGSSSGDSSLQVAPPSVILPTPPLPAASPLPEASPAPEEAPTPAPTPPPQFTPPTGQSLNLPSALPAGNPQFAPASVGMPSLSLDDSSAGPGALGGIFDWAKKLRFQVALRGGFDNNVNGGNGTNAIASTFANLNGGVSYRFGSPRLSFSANLTGGVTRYFNSNISQPLQGTMGLGLEVDYRFNPVLVFTFNSSSSYQQQPNITLVGTPNNSNSGYYYSANSLAAAYQWSDLFTTVSRFNLTGSYFPNNNNNQGFTQPGFTQSFRYLVRPTTTAVLDYTTDYYGYGTSGNSSLGQTVDVGFDHVFNPKWFWNFRLGADFRTSQNATGGSGTYFGPYFDSNFSWATGKNSSINWLAHFGTQPSGQNNSSYSTALSSGLNYTQGIFTKLKFNLGLYYVLNTYPDSPVGPLAATVVNNQIVLYNQLISYNQTNIQANLSLTYQLNRIIDLSVGYQYITADTPAIPSQSYNRSITYLQVRGGF